MNMNLLLSIYNFDVIVNVCNNLVRNMCLFVPYIDSNTNTVTDG